MGEVIKRRLSFGDESEQEDLVPVNGGEGAYVVPVGAVQLEEYAVAIETVDMEVALAFLPPPEFKARIMAMLARRIAEVIVNTGKVIERRDEVTGKTIHELRLVVAKNRGK